MTFPLSGGTYGGAHTASPIGAPPKPSRYGGFGGERRRKGVNGAFRPKGGNGVHGLFDDVGMPGGQGVLAGDGSSPLPGEPLRQLSLPPPLTGEARSAPRQSPLTGEMSRRGRGVHGGESCTVVSIFYCMSRVAGQQSLPCVKGGGVRKDTGGIDAEQFC